MQSTQPRLFFLDWVRIIAFLLLILYHVGMYYVSWDWHVKSPFASDTIEPFMILSSPWRLSLLFLISGVASSFMLAKIGAGKFMRQRSVRLLVPLIFGMFVIVPPQPYFEVIEKFAYLKQLRRVHAPVRERQRRLLQIKRLPGSADLEPSVVRGLPVGLHAAAGHGHHAVG
ncbi:acyltransferase family protein [Massilia sp. B-10]|nr:acyltransferase family protein [Massilia sp. B-10]